MPELGEVLLIHLDPNQLETRGMAPLDVANKIPDLFRSGLRDPTARTYSFKDA